jgi:hypothetical protein
VGGERPFFAKIRSAIEMPGIGSLLYRLNVNSFIVGKMVAGHVYSDPTWLSGERLIEKRQVMDAPGARFASAAFVTGALDRASSRADFLALAARAAVPIFLIYGAETPSRSRAEMDALAAVPGVRTEFIRDIAPIASVRRAAGVMEVNPSVPAKTVPEFIAYAKANPGKINMATAGVGSAPHLYGQLFKIMAGVDLVTVNYRGSALALPDLIGGPGADHVRCCDFVHWAHQDRKADAPRGDDLHTSGRVAECPTDRRFCVGL